MALDVTNLARHFFPYVEKPDRYTGNELYLPEYPDHPAVRAVLAFPDTYELGMSYLGLRILYHLGNQVNGAAVERVFMPWMDAVAQLRQLDLPLFSLETKTPLAEFDLIGFNLQYELHATNILAMLDLAKIPLRAADREESHPLVIGGGPLTYSPEPFAPFFDALVIGDGEDVFREILEVLKAQKASRASRSERITALGELEGVYIPSWYESRYTEKGHYDGLQKRVKTAPAAIRARITPQLQTSYYPTRPLVPVLEPTHDRYVMEIARGCSRGCRFCEPGMTNRPVRERPVGELIEEAAAGLDATGFSDLSLLSLSTADYRYLAELLDGLEPLLTRRGVSLSFPSLRPDMFTEQMAQRASHYRRTGLTFAPEAATARLRKVINKQTTDEALLKAAGHAFASGWQLIKLYFMIGLPSETDDDIQAIVALVKRVVALTGDRRGIKINVSISPFSPKPHTPFERTGQQTPDELRRRLQLLKEGLRGTKSVRLELRAPEISRFELLLSRGNRRTADAIEASYRAGGMFDAWSDGFFARRWEEAFRQAGIDSNEAVKTIPQHHPLPWDHIDTFIDPEFLQDERDRSRKGLFTADCRVENCNFCGLHTHDDMPCPDIVDLPVDLPETEAAPVVVAGDPHRYRLLYARGIHLRFSAHRNIITLLERALRRLPVPLEMTQGFHPHVKLTTAPPIGSGMTSRCELLDFGILGIWQADYLARLREALPAGLVIHDVIELIGKQQSVGALNASLYQAKPVEDRILNDLNGRIAELWSAEHIPILRSGPKGSKAFDARPGLWKLALENGCLMVGIKSSGGPQPRVDEILRLIITGDDGNSPISPADIAAEWQIERIGLWWEEGNQFTAPAECFEEAFSEQK